MPYYLEDLKKLFAHLYKVCRGRSGLISYTCVKNFLLNPLGYGINKEEFKEILLEAIDKGIITEIERKGEKFIKLQYDYSSYDVKEKPELRKYSDVGYEIERLIQKVTGEDINEIRRKITKIAVDLGLYYPIAAYIFAKYYGIDVSEFEQDLWSILSKA